MPISSQRLRKDGKLTAERVPIITRRTLLPGDSSRHPMCVYDAVRAAWDMQSLKDSARPNPIRKLGYVTGQKFFVFFYRVAELFRRFF